MNDFFNRDFRFRSRRYFDSPGEFEARIEGNMELEALEDELRESCGSYMRRFFALLDAAVAYHDELCSYLNDLQVRPDLGNSFIVAVDS